MGKRIVVLSALACLLLSALPAGTAKSCLVKFYTSYEAKKSIPKVAFLGKKEKPEIFYECEGADLTSLREDKYCKIVGASAWTMPKGSVLTRSNKSWLKDIYNFTRSSKQKYAFVMGEAGEGSAYTHKVYLLRPYTEDEMAKWKFGVELRELTDSERRRHARDGGVRVVAAFSDYPAVQAGIRRGDIITHLDGVPVKGLAAFLESEGRAREGDVVSVRLVRNAKEMQIDVRL